MHLYAGYLVVLRYAHENGEPLRLEVISMYCSMPLRTNILSEKDTNHNGNILDSIEESKCINNMTELLLKGRPRCATLALDALLGPRL